VGLKEASPLGRRIVEEKPIHLEKIGHKVLALFASVEIALGFHDCSQECLRIA
jgi:hypothetical protein